MDIWGLFTDYTIRNVTLGSAILGLVSGGLSTFAVLRRQSLLGDAISHAALPGIGLAFLFTHNKELMILLAGAFVAGWIGTGLMTLIIRHSRLKEDTALALVLSVFFGFGIVVLTHIQKLPIASQAGLESFLFGQAASLVASDVRLFTLISLIVFALIALFWKEFKLLTLDPDFTQTQGYPIWFLDTLLTTLLVVAIVIGLQTVGVVLMSAMIVAPGASARQWTDRMGIMFFLSGFFGLLAGTAGALTSSFVEKLPTGPTIVVYLSVIVAVSVLFAPHRGLVAGWIRRRTANVEIFKYTVLLALYDLSRHHPDERHGHSEKVIEKTLPAEVDVHKILQALETEHLIQRVNHNHWIITAEGLQKINQLNSEHVNHD